MKNFYVECTVKFTENNILDTENYSFTIQTNSKKNAEIEAKQQAIRQFNDELNDGFENISVSVDQSYETSCNARSS